MARYLLISPDYPPPFVGGSLVYIHNLLTNSHLKFDVLTNNNSRKNDNFISHIESKYMTNSNSPSAFGLIKMYIYLFFISFTIRKYEVIVLNVSVIGNGMLAFLLNFLGIKTIIISYAEEITMSMNAPGMKGAIKRLFLSLYKKTNAIVSVSNFAKEILENKVGVLSPIYVIPTPLHALKTLNGHNKPLAKKKGQILSVGRLIKRKGFVNLIRAFEVIKHSIPRATLIIVGYGPEYNELNNEISKLGLSESVFIYQDISDKNLSNLYLSSELFVLANLLLENGDCEGAPNVIVEASSFGLPVVAGVYGGVSDVVNHTVTGYLVDTKNIEDISSNVINLLNDENLMNSMSNNSINKVSTDHDKNKAGLTFSKIIKNI